MPILLEDLNLKKAERLLCNQALSRAGSIVEAAQLLGITRHALKRRMVKHAIEWPLRAPQVAPISTYRSSGMDAPVPMRAASSEG